MDNRKQPTPPPDVIQKPQMPPKPTERKRTAFEFLRDLLRDAAWYRSAIELDLYGENPRDGESLQREAEEIVLSEATRRVNEGLEDDYIQGGDTYDLVNLMSGAVPAIDYRELLRKFIIYTLTSDPTDQVVIEVAAEWFGNRLRHSPDFTAEEKAELVRLANEDAR